MNEATSHPPVYDSIVPKRTTSDELLQLMKRNRIRPTRDAYSPATDENGLIVVWSYPHALITLKRMIPQGKQVFAYCVDHLEFITPVKETPHDQQEKRKPRKRSRSRRHAEV